MNPIVFVSKIALPLREAYMFSVWTWQVPEGVYHLIPQLSILATEPGVLISFKQFTISLTIGSIC